MRLNKYIAHSGICSRREADELIASGDVQVNDVVTKEMGVQVKPGDQIKVRGSLINPEDFIYILLHKPRNTITTTSDEKGRGTVMDLIEDATGARVYPVGRLDRNTTGALLLTNDGDLANRLMHPSYEVRKIYEVQTKGDIPDSDLELLKKGITLDDGPASAYNIQRLEGYRNFIRMSIHEGRNRLVRRMMEALGHEVEKLHRPIYAGLTLKNVRPGRWRYLTIQEVNDLRGLVKLFVSKTKRK